MNIVEVIHGETAAYAGRVAIVEGDRTITYGELLARIDALAGRLAAEGISVGQRVGFRCADGIDYVIGALALLRAGAAVVPVADTLTAGEITETLERICCNATLVHRRLKPIPGEVGGKEIDDTFALQALRGDAELDERCRANDAAFIRFSSGTTGQSKGVVISHGSIRERIEAANRGMRINHEDVILWVLGMSHHFVVSILLFLRRGATIVVANQRFPFSVLEATAKFELTFMYGSPVHFYLLAVSKQVEAAALGKVRMAISTSMKMPREIAERFTEKFGFAPAEAYGIIEVGLPFINCHPDPASPNTVGPVQPDYRLKIDEADADGVGEVLIQGKGMFDAYCSPWRLRGEVLREGWFDTGDLGRVDERGNLCLMGRSKTVIVCAGMKVFPEEVEAVINNWPGVKESLVSGKAHPQFGQTPVAEVVVHGNVVDAQRVMDGLRGHCMGVLSSYKVPLEFRVVGALAKTASGKLARAVQR